MDKFIGDVLSYVNNFIVLINLEGKISFVNSAFEKLMSPNVELVGQCFDFLATQLSIETLGNSFRDILKRLPLIDIEHIYKGDNGIELHLSWSFFPRIDNSNITQGIVVIGK